jgi:isoamylase
VRCLGMLLSGRTIDDVDRYGEPLRDDTFLFCLNPHYEHIQFYMPPCSTGCVWELLIDTRYAASTEQRFLKAGEFYDMTDHTAIPLREATGTSGT